MPVREKALLPAAVILALSSLLPLVNVTSAFSMAKASAVLVVMSPRSTTASLRGPEAAVPLMEKAGVTPVKSPFTTILLNFQLLSVALVGLMTSVWMFAVEEVT